MTPKFSQNVVPRPTWPHRGNENAVPGPTWPRRGDQNAVPGRTWPRRPLNFIDFLKGKRYFSQNAVPGPTWPHRGDQNGVPVPTWRPQTSFSKPNPKLLTNAVSRQVQKNVESTKLIRTRTIASQRWDNQTIRRWISTGAR